MCLRQVLRQQWFLLILIPFAIILLCAPLLPAPSETHAYRLLVRVALSASAVVLFVGIILTGSAALPAEVRDRTLHRSAASPGGRLTALTGRIAAFSILAALVSGVGFLTPLRVYAVRAESSEEFKAASKQYQTASAERRLYGNSPAPSPASGVLWINEKVPTMTWVFPRDAMSPGGKRVFRIVPVVASTIETQANLIVITKGRVEIELEPIPIKLFDNRPTTVELPGPLDRNAVLNLRIERLPGSSPFGFDVRKNELGSERNGVSLLTGRCQFAANLLAAWFVVWLKLCFVASLAVFASTFLSAPVAAAFSLLLYLLASILGFLTDFAASIGEIGAHVHSHIHHAPQGPQELTFFESAAKTLLAWFAGLYPDLSRFDAAEALVWGHAIPVGFLLAALLYYLLYCAVFWGASALILQRREL
jgi:hypothetical protein